VVFSGIKRGSLGGTGIEGEETGGKVSLGAEDAGILVFRTEDLCFSVKILVRRIELRKKRRTKIIVILFKKLVGPAPPKIASAPLKTAPYSEPLVTFIKTIRIIKIAKTI